jgi:serine/threonine-protein kinase RsbW
MDYLHPEAQLQEFAFRSNAQSIASLEFLLDELKEQMALSEEVYRCVWIVLNEAVTNAIVHGNKNNPAKKVTLSVEMKGDMVCFIVKDEGQGFDPSTVPDPTTPERILEPDGRGVFLIKKLSDKVAWSCNGTVVEMCFYMRG